MGESIKDLFGIFWMNFVSGFTLNTSISFCKITACNLNKLASGPH